MGGTLAAAWRYRHFITSSVRAEFANRFARSRLGGLWMVLNPLAQRGQQANSGDNNTTHDEKAP